VSGESDELQCRATTDPTDFNAVAVRTAVWVHAELIKIQPFMDGNKRTSRLVMDMVLSGLGIQPAPLEIPRKEYLVALGVYYRGDCEPLENVVIEAISRP